MRVPEKVAGIGQPLQGRHAILVAKLAVKGERSPRIGKVIGHAPEAGDAVMVNVAVRLPAIWTRVSHWIRPPYSMLEATLRSN